MAAPPHDPNEVKQLQPQTQNGDAKRALVLAFRLQNYGYFGYWDFFMMVVSTQTCIRLDLTRSRSALCPAHSKGSDRV